MMDSMLPKLIMFAKFALQVICAPLELELLLNVALMNFSFSMDKLLVIHVHLILILRKAKRIAVSALMVIFVVLEPLLNVPQGNMERITNA
jgi:hypothetical protein